MSRLTCGGLQPPSLCHTAHLVAFITYELPFSHAADSMNSNDLCPPKLPAAPDPSLWCLTSSKKDVGVINEPAGLQVVEQPPQLGVYELSERVGLDQGGWGGWGARRG